MYIHHIAIWTADLERLKHFYETYFGVSAGPKYANPSKGFESYFLTFASGARIELMHMPGIPTTQNDPITQASGLTHLSISTGSAEAVDELTARLARDGFRVASQPRRTGDGYYESVVLDPDGNRVEICA
ncbi:MAG TPA: VOC family protein [Anaerolineaceae bacterium]